MTLHDAAITSFGQWWQRTRRTGWAFAAGAARHGTIFGGHNVRSLLRAIVWGLASPVLLLLSLTVAPWHPEALLCAAALAVMFAVIVVRTCCARLRQGNALGDAILYAVFCAIGKVPEALGAVSYVAQRARGAPMRIIEYKD